MAYEFKTLGSVEALTEVPENANALVEVDGAIKRVPGSALGGGEYDLVITDDQANEILTIDSGSYQSVYNKIMVDKEPPKILIKYCFDYGDFGYGVISNYSYAEIVVNSEDSNSHSLKVHYKTYMWDERTLNVYSDGTIEVA